MRIRSCSITLAGLLLAGVAAAQPVTTPMDSQRASVAQRIGLTDVTVVYHRPLVDGRTIWGGLVPYGEVWRAGANDNTTISFTHDVTVENKPLPAGTYGLHMLPTAGDWTVIFSKNSTSWGSFSYDQAEDALRVTVKPEPTAFHEALTYEFDEVAADEAVVALKWEKLRVPFKVGVDVDKVVLANIKNELRHVNGFSWMGWSSAAAWALQRDINLEEALTWADRSIQAEERFENLATKAQLLEKLGRGAEAEPLMAKALQIGNAGQVHFYARQLLGRGQKEKALAVFKMNAEKNPGSYIVEAGLARAYSATGDFANAVVHMKKAHELAPEQAKAGLAGLIARLEKKEDIN